MKQERKTHYCINKSCGWKETTHRLLDGIRCPECNDIVISYSSKK